MQRKVTLQVGSVVDGVAEGSKSAEHTICEQLQLGVEAADRGETVPFDPDAIKKAGRERLNQQ